MKFFEFSKLQRREVWGADGPKVGDIPGRPESAPKVARGHLGERGDLVGHRGLLPDVQNSL